MVRAPCCDKMGLKRGPWTPEEDQILIDYIQKHGHGNWRALPKHAGLLRCGKSCRLRWTNYLRPDIKRGNFTREEEDTIIKLHELLGNRWSAIAARLPGRTDNEIKNVWHTHLKKRLNQNQSGLEKKVHSRRKHASDIVQSVKGMSTVTVPDEIMLDDAKHMVTSPQPCSSDLSSCTDCCSLANEQLPCSSDFSSDYPGFAVAGQDLLDILLQENAEFDESLWSETLSCESPEASEINDGAMVLPLSMATDDTVFPIFPPGESYLKSEPCNDEIMDFWFNLFVKASDTNELTDF